MAKIVTTPAVVLSQKAKPVKKVDKEVKKIVNDMIMALNSASDPIGVGLAAPQIGLPLRIFITKPAINSPIQVFINPTYVKQDPKSVNLSEPQTKPKTTRRKPVKLEGCLSIPNIWGEVKRKSVATLSYLDQNGKKYKKTFRGLMAIIVQHEMDHLEGILFPKHVLEQKGVLYKSNRNEKGEDIFEEIEI